MNRRCEVCGVEHNNIRYSSSSLIWGDSCFCSSSCHNIAKRYHYLLAGCITTLLALIMINFVLVALSFVIVTLYLFAFAYKGFTLIKEREGEVPTESNNEFTIRLERLNEKLKKTQNETQVRIGNIDSRTTTQDTDPKSFFNITNGKLKDRQ